MKALNRFVQIGVLALIVAAVVQEMNKPKSKRSWNGQLFGFIPYDFRWPSPERLRSTLWNAKSHEILVPTAFGVGWSLNFPAALDVARKASGLA